jgi:hypothetical protein
VSAVPRITVGRMSTADVVDIRSTTAGEAAGEVLDRDPAMKLKTGVYVGLDLGPPAWRTEIMSMMHHLR